MNIRITILALLASTLLGCASSAPMLGEKLDPSTSATLTFSTTPMVLYRDDPAHAAFARNFVSLGPLQVNRGGHHRFFVWLGLWNTNQTVSVADRRDGFDSIVLFVNGEPLTLDLAGWTPDAIGASEPVYPQPVASALDAYYEVTADQIRLIANSDDVSLRTTGAAARSFEPWDDQAEARQSFRKFLSQVIY